MTFQIDREHVHCGLCGADEPRLLHRIQTKDLVLNTIWLDGQEHQLNTIEHLVRCGRCGMVYVNPRIVDTPGLAPYSLEQELAYFADTRNTRRMAFRDLVRRLPGWLGRPVGSLLDIGCGDGLLLEAAAQAGITEVRGLEISLALIDQVTRRMGAGIASQGPIEAYPAAYFDVVALINVLEHLRHPREMLIQAHGKLQSDGILLIHIPNLAGLPARLRGRRWHQIEPFAHFHYFTPNSLEHMLDSTGFTPFARFHLRPASRWRNAIQSTLTRMGLYLDNGLGMVARRVD